MLTFIDGDPDRPVIAGAVPNPETPSVVKDANQTMAAIQTGGNNRIAIEDKAGSERILMHVPNRKAYIRIGAPNDPPPGGGPPEPPTTATTPPPHDEDYEELSKELSELEAEVEGIKAEMEGDLEFKCHNKKETISGNSFTMVIGAEESIYVGNYSHIKFLTAFDLIIGLKLDVVLAASFELKCAWSWAFNVEGHGRFAPQKRELALDVSHMHLKKVDLDGEVTDLRAYHNILAGEVAKLQAKTSELAVETSSLSAQTSMLAATTSEIMGSVDTIQGEAAQMLGENLHMVVDSSLLVTQHTELIGNSLRTAAEQAQVNGEQNILNGFTVIV
jgi:type VI secretion system secreted protein VgrG